MLLKLLNLQETRVKFTEQQGAFSGYASVFNGIDSYGDTIYPGAYADTLKNRRRPVRMRWNHFGPVIGKWTNIYEDEKGLYVEGELTPGHTQAMDVYASLKHGAISGLSIGYRVIDGEENETGGMNLRRIDLVEISVVEDEADLGAKVGFIKALEESQSVKEIESLLREAAGMSRDEAKLVIARIKQQDQVREAPENESHIATALRLKTHELLS